MKNKYKIIKEDGVVTIENQFGYKYDVPVKAGEVIIYANGQDKIWEIFIDGADLEKVDKTTSGHWYISINKGTIYAYFCKQEGGSRTYFAMHRIITDCPDGMVADHSPHHYGLDNRRNNLRVVTPEQNSKNKVFCRKNKFKDSTEFEL